MLGYNIRSRDEVQHQHEEVIPELKSQRSLAREILTQEEGSELGLE